MTCYWCFWLSLNQNVYSDSVDYSSIDRSDILNIHKYVMVKKNIKNVRISWKLFIALLMPVTKINESKSSCKCKCWFDVRKCNSSQKWDNDKCRCECKNLEEHSMSEKKTIYGILLHVVVKMVNV